MAKTLRSLLIGMPVRTTKRIQWHGLDIPKGTRGYIMAVAKSGDVVNVKFSSQYGNMECWAKELRPA